MRGCSGRLIALQGPPLPLLPILLVSVPASLATPPLHALCRSLAPHHGLPAP